MDTAVLLGNFPLDEKMVTNRGSITNVITMYLDKGLFLRYDFAGHLN